MYTAWEREDGKPHLKTVKLAHSSYSCVMWAERITEEVVANSADDVTVLTAFVRCCSNGKDLLDAFIHILTWTAQALTDFLHDAQVKISRRFQQH